MIIFENKGVVPIEAFTTLGVNAKPATDNPIGHFGTGLKYALAVCLRLGGTFTLYRGTEEYEFYVKDMEFRDKEFQVVRMKRRKGFASRWTYEKLPFTLEFGKEWEPWMAVRELESNMRDEEHGLSFNTDDPTLAVPMDGHTTIIIDCSQMEAAYKELDKIFMSPDKELLFKHNCLEVYKGPSDYVFYRGLRVTDIAGKPSMFTYNFTDGVTLTEDRTSKNPGLDTYSIMNALRQSNDVHLLEGVMERLADEDQPQCYESEFQWDTRYAPHSVTFMAALGARLAEERPIYGRMGTYYEAFNPKPPEHESTEVVLRQEDAKWLSDFLGQLQFTQENNDHRERILAALVKAGITEPSDDEVLF